MKNNLLNVDIVTINCKNPPDGINAINHCSKWFNFGRKIIFTDSYVSQDGIENIQINKIKSIDEYNDFVLGLSKYLNNDYVLIVQDDGFIVNPYLWDPNFLDYDYIGSPWPSSEDLYWISLQNPKIIPHMERILPKNRTGNGGFSLRSKKFLEYSSKFKTCDGVGEDVFLCLQNYEVAISLGINFAPFELSKKFSHEIPFDSSNKKWITKESEIFSIESHFGFHGRNFSNSEILINLKNS
jgi:hypothetical protein